MTSDAPVLALGFLMLLVSSSCVVAWTKGRATFYGNEPWYWSIHHGSCGFGYLWPDQSTGWDIAAMPDTLPEYRGSCDGCYEVKCDATGVTDGYGQYLNRNSACKDTSASVVIKTSDTCPCQKADNWYSNKRWCCGDKPHLDLSVWAFQKLADIKWGVIPIQYRKVDCGYQPQNKAWLDYSQSLPGEFPPKWQANQRPGFDWYRYFPKGGYLNSHAGDGSRMVSTDEYLRLVGQGGSQSSNSAQYGKKK